MTDQSSSSPSIPSLQDLVPRAASGDERAWRLLVHRFKRLVYSIPKSYNLTDAVCDDVFQSVFTSLVRQLPNIADPDALPKWLITSTHRECWKAAALANRVRSDNSHHAVEQHSPDSLHDRWERRLALDTGLTALGGRCERLLRLLYLSHNPPPYDAVAASLNMPLGSIGPTRARCLAKLSELIPQGHSPN